MFGATPLTFRAQPVFSLKAENGTLTHLKEHEGRRLISTNVRLASNDTMGFNGRDSMLTYSVDEWPELLLAGAFTIHARVCFHSHSDEQFVFGRYGLNYLTAPNGWPQGNFCYRPGGLTPTNSRAWCNLGQYYDVLMRFEPGTDIERASTLIEVYHTANGQLLGRNHEMPRSFDGMPFGLPDAPFVLGQAGDYTAFDGEIAELRIWNSWLETEGNQTKPAQSLPPSEERPQHSIPAQIGPASQHWQKWLQSRVSFPIAAWGYFHRYPATIEEYTTYREAGLTMVMAPLESAERAEVAGLDTIIGLWEDNGEYAELYKHPKRMQGYQDFAREKLTRCAGYMLADEPRYGGPGVAELAPGFRAIYAETNIALPMVNLMTYAYNMGGGFGYYVDDVIRHTQPPFLVADPYVLFTDGRSNDDQFYANSAVVRQKAISAGIGFMGFILTTGHRRPFPEYSFRSASESDLYWQANTLLAYGAQGLWYYNYRISGEGFEEALVSDIEGQPTARYYWAQKLNRGITAIGSLMMKLRSTAVFHTVDGDEFLPEFTTPYQDGCLSGLQQLHGQHLVVAELAEKDSPGDKTECYLMIVNKRHAQVGKDQDLLNHVVLTFSPDSSVEKIDNDSGAMSLIHEGPLPLTLEGGERAFFRLSSNRESA